MLLATGHFIGAFNTASSILDTSYASQDSGEITAFALSVTDPDYVHVGTREGYIISWNWRDNKVNGRWSTNAPIFGLACGQLENSDYDTIFTIDQTEQSCNLTAHRFGIDGDLSRTALSTLLKHDSSIRSLRILSDGKAIAALTPHSVLIGKLPDGHNPRLKRVAYSWRELPCKEPPTCLQLRRSHQRASIFDIDLAIGGLKGSISLYREVFAKTGSTEQPSKHALSKGNIPGAHMHWHREAVGALAFSQDADYLISGGRETVLVLWQLNTGKKQFLPHLESPVDSISVSPSGASYAVALADNSVMVLSTAELKPTANFAGLQTVATSTLPPHQLMLPTREILEQVSCDAQAPLVLGIVNPSKPAEALFAVASLQSSRADIFPHTSPRPFLQTFSLNPHTCPGHIRRQALARTNVTSSNLGPGGHRLTEADIACMSITANGKWLATIDAWSPSPADLEDLSISRAETDHEKANHLIVSLRFWLWREPEAGKGGWELNTRIDNPHTLDGSRRSGKVLALTASPSASGFLSIGEDGTLRIWRPKSRGLDGRVYWRETAPLDANQKSSKRARARINTWWTSQHVVALHAPVADEMHSCLHADRATVAFSGDSSLIAVHIHHSTSSDSQLLTRPNSDETRDYEDPVNTTIHFVDVDAGIVQELRSDLCPRLETEDAAGLSPHMENDGICALGFLGTRLIVVTRKVLAIWEVTSFELLAAMTIPTAPTLIKHAEQSDRRVPQSSAPAPMLAINAATRSVAVMSAVPTPHADQVKAFNATLPPHTHREYVSRVQIYELDEKTPAGKLEPVFDRTMPRLSLCLLDAAGSASVDDSATLDGGLRGERSGLTRRVLAQGYHIVDSTATLRSIKPRISLSVTDTTAAESVQDSQATEQALSQRLSADKISMAHAARRGDNEAASDDEAQELRLSREGPVVTTEQLSSILEPSSARAVPSLADMFQGVIEMFAGKAIDT